jgi:hypothetical protein
VYKFLSCWSVLYTATPVVQTAAGGGVSVYICEWPIWPTELSQPTTGLSQLPEQRGEPQQAVPQMESAATRRQRPQPQGGPRVRAEPLMANRGARWWTQTGPGKGGSRRRLMTKFLNTLPPPPPPLEDSSSSSWEVTDVETLKH